MGEIGSMQKVHSGGDSREWQRVAGQGLHPWVCTQEACNHQQRMRVTPPAAPTGLAVLPFP